MPGGQLPVSATPSDGRRGSRPLSPPPPPPPPPFGQRPPGRTALLAGFRQEAKLRVLGQWQSGVGGDSVPAESSPPSPRCSLRPEHRGPPRGCSCTSSAGNPHVGTSCSPALRWQRKGNAEKGEPEEHEHPFGATHRAALRPARPFASAGFSLTPRETRLPWQGSGPRCFTEGNAGVRGWQD